MSAILRVERVEPAGRHDRLQPRQRFVDPVAAVAEAHDPRAAQPRRRLTEQRRRVAFRPSELDDQIRLEAERHAVPLRPLRRRQIVRRRRVGVDQRVQNAASSAIR